MRRSNNSTHERILNQGLDLLSEAGLSGVTLGVLAEQVGMSKSGLFAHFRSKEEVQIALLQQTVEIANAYVLAPALSEPEGLPRLRAVVTRWFGWTTRAGLRGGCPIAAAMFELDDIEGPVREKVLAMEAEWRALLIGMVQQAMARKQLRADLDAEQFVWELGGIYLSHHVSRRFLKSADADERAHVAFEALLARALP